ncbi:hypothetical protein WJX74_003975 [Apatococcus lobatus]|uniref:BZIP domain-containing protein n=1 Tax=Apatococcus lobatus TaxID=904363 RepID=A0AAW1SFD5_9CHLO
MTSPSLPKQQNLQRQPVSSLASLASSSTCFPATGSDPRPSRHIQPLDTWALSGAPAGNSHSCLRKAESDATFLPSHALAVRSQPPSLDRPIIPSQADLMPLVSPFAPWPLQHSQSAAAVQQSMHTRHSSCPAAARKLPQPSEAPCHQLSGSLSCQAGVPGVKATAQLPGRSLKPCAPAGLEGQQGSNDMAFRPELPSCTTSLTTCVSTREMAAAQACGVTPSAQQQPRDTQGSADGGEDSRQPSLPGNAPKPVRQADAAVTVRTKNNVASKAWRDRKRAHHKECEMKLLHLEALERRLSAELDTQLPRSRPLEPLSLSLPPPAAGPSVLPDESGSQGRYDGIQDPHALSRQRSHAAIAGMPFESAAAPFDGNGNHAPCKQELKLSGAQMRSTVELWASYVEDLSSLKQEWQSSREALETHKIPQLHAAGHTPPTQALDGKRQPLTDIRALQNELAVHLIRRFHFEVLTPVQVGHLLARAHTVSPPWLAIIYTQAHGYALAVAVATGGPMPQTLPDRGLWPWQPASATLDAVSGQELLGSVQASVHPPRSQLVHPMTAPHCSSTETSEPAAMAALPWHMSSPLTLYHQLAIRVGPPFPEPQVQAGSFGTIFHLNRGGFLKASENGEHALSTTRGHLIRPCLMSTLTESCSNQELQGPQVHVMGREAGDIPRPRQVRRHCLPVSIPKSLSLPSTKPHFTASASAESDVHLPSQTQKQQLLSVPPRKRHKFADAHVALLPGQISAPGLSAFSCLAGSSLCGGRPASTP